MIEVARLEARAPIALGDCFAVVTAAAHGLPLLTGGPELIDLRDPPFVVEDVRAVRTDQVCGSTDEPTCPAVSAP